MMGGGKMARDLLRLVGTTGKSDDDFGAWRFVGTSEPDSMHLVDGFFGLCIATTGWDADTHKG